MKKIIFERLKLNQKRKIRGGTDQRIVLPVVLGDRPDDDPKCQGGVVPVPQFETCIPPTGTDSCPASIVISNNTL